MPFDRVQVRCKVGGHVGAQASLQWVADVLSPRGRNPIPNNELDQANRTPQQKREMYGRVGLHGLSRWGA
jgi:hypothetical protein